MDPVYSRPICFSRPRPPKTVHVRASSRAATLDALEYGPRLTRSDLTELTELGETTLRHAVRQLSREGVLTSESRCNAAPVSVARYAALPVLDITPHRMTWRLCDTLGGSVFATVRERGLFRSPEDDLIALMGQVSTILSAGTCGLSHRIPLQPPVLICPDGEHNESLPSLLPLMSPPPDRILSPEEAVAEELPYLSATRESEVVLHIRTGEATRESLGLQVTLFSRLAAHERSGPFVPSPVVSDLAQSLRPYLGSHPSYTAAWWKQVAAFLGDLSRFIRLSCVVVEVDRPQEHAAVLRSTLPADVKLARIRYAHNTPPLSHRGALRIIRRALWDRMEGAQISR